MNLNTLVVIILRLMAIKLFVIAICNIPNLVCMTMATFHGNAFLPSLLSFVFYNITTYSERIF